MAHDGNIGDQVVGWYGRVAANNLEKNPGFVSGWLKMGYELMTQKSKHLPDRNLCPSGQRGYALFMESVVDAYLDVDKSVITSIFLPTQIFRALGLKPLTAEAAAAFVSGAQAEDAFIARANGAGFPETYCSYHRALLGLVDSGVLAPRKLVASCSVACDANNLTFRELQRRWGCERAYVDIPYDTGDDSIHYVADQLRDLVTLTEDAYGQKLDHQALRALVDTSLKTEQTLLQTLPARRGHYLANTMTLDMMEMLDFQLSLGLPQTDALANQMLRDFSRAPAYQSVNLVWAHVSPFFLGSLGALIDHAPTAQIVASDMMFHQALPAEGKHFGADEPFEAMAESMVKSCYNGPASRRADTLRRLAQATGADGVVVFCHWGCKETAGAAQYFKRTLEAAGYPTLVLDGDGCDRSNCMEGQLSTRFSAFIEMLRARR